MDLQPPTARVVRQGGEVETAVEDVCVGDVVVVRPGERIPVDGDGHGGRIGRGRIHAHRRKHAGGQMRPAPQVFAGTINRSGAFRYEATKVGRGTALQQMIELVKQAQGSRAPVARLADVVSGYFTVTVLVLALVTFGAWLFFAPFGTWRWSTPWRC